MALPDLEKRLMPPEERGQYELGSSLRSLKRSHGKYKYRHLKAPTSEADLSDDDLAKIAFDYAEKAGGASDEIVSRAQKYYDLISAEQQRRVGRQGAETLTAIKAGAAETPHTVMPTPEQAEAIPKGEWFLTEEQAKLRVAKSGAIPPDQIRHFMMGQYSPESKKLLEKTLATPQVGPPEKFEGAETSRIGRAVSTLFDVLGTGGRASASGMAANMKHARESGLIDKAIKKKNPAFLESSGLLEAAKGAAKGVVKAEDAPNLEAEIVKTRDYLIQLAFDEAEKELKGFSGEDITNMAKHKYNKFADKISVFGKDFFEHPSKSATAWEIFADPIMYAGGAPYKLGAAAVGKVVPQAAKMALAKGAAKGLGWISYRAKFLPLEQMGDEGKKLAEGLRFAETNLGPGAKAKMDEMAEQASNLFKRVKKEDRKLFFDVVHKKKPIEALPESLRGIVPQTKEFSDELYNVKVKAGTAQTLVSPKGAHVKELAGLGNIGNKLARELEYAKLTVGDEAAHELSRRWKLVREFAKKNKLKREDFREMVKYIDGSTEYLPRKLEKNDKIWDLAKGARLSVENIRNKYKIPIAESGQIVQKAAYLKDYGSPLLMQEKGFGTGIPRKYKGVTTGSVMHRTGKGHPVEDVGKQFEYALEAESKTAARVAAFAGIKKSSKEAEVWHLYKPSKKGPALEEELRGAEIAFNEVNQSGIPFKALEEELTKKILKVTEQPGTIIKKGTRIMVPEPVEQTILRVAEVFNPEQSAKAFGDLYNSTIKPMQNMWRINATVLRSPQFLATNFVGAIGLGILALGIKALNPFLQRDAIRTAAVAAFGGSSKALKTQIKLARGETKTLGELYDLMRDIGIIGQYKKRYALDMPGTGILGKAEQMYRKIPALGPEIAGKKISLQGMAAFGDEYQHAVTFLGALKSTSPDDIAKAADFTAKFAGNYNRLTWVERTFLKEISGFYTWNRFILPHVTKQIFENPQRLAVWEKLKQGWEAYYGENRPVFEAGIPNWIKLQTAATAPESMQPDNPHEMAMMALETPQNTLGALVGESAVPFMLGPGASAMVELITGIDLKTGRRRPDIEPYIPNTIETKDRLINLAEQTFPMGEALSNLGKLYWDFGQHSAAAETWLKYRVARDWLNIDRLVTGQKPLGIPVLTKTYAFQPMREAARKKRRALGD